MGQDVNSYKVRLSMGHDVNSYKVRLCIGNLLSPTEQSDIRMKLPKEIKGKVKGKQTRPYPGVNRSSRYSMSTKLRSFTRFEPFIIMRKVSEKETDREGGSNDVR
jgi:hypothetical protein